MPILTIEQAAKLESLPRWKEFLADPLSCCPGFKGDPRTWTPKRERENGETMQWLFAQRDAYIADGWGKNQA